ncbi:FAD binding domain-containing protein [Bradyrhizobium sp. LA6.12]|uniref:FAD binding domain-containing protein n=1 Tax=unclassified Bradyrhizobium TaxID=2631580 RepID=UPI003398C072
MQPFEFSRPADLAQAIAAAHAPDARPIAGGTELLNLMREGIYHPQRIFDLNGLGELARIDVKPDGLAIGALARLSDIAIHEAVVRDFPAITQALLESASPQIRNMATIGGNLMQRTRCGYFRNGDIDAKCNKRATGSGCAAVDAGQVRDFAIFGASEACIATHPSDVAVALAALDARVHLRSAAAARTVPVVDFIRLPGTTPERDTDLRDDELIVAVEVPAAAAASSSVFLKLRDRASYEFALLSASAALTLDHGRISTARLALGGLAHRPWRFTGVEQALTGIAPDDAQIGTIIANELGKVPARPGSEIKLELAARLALRAVRAAAGLV